MAAPIDFANLPVHSREFAAAAMERFSAHNESLKSSRRHHRMRRAWMQYYSRSADSGVDETEINSAGERGELTLIKPNRWRRIVGDQINQVAQTPPDPEPMAINTDPDSQTQVRLAKGISEWYRRTAHLDELRVDAARMAVVLLESYWHVRWDTSAGDEMVDENRQPYYAGDFAFSIRSGYDVAYSRHSPDPRRPRWWIVREPVNRFDLAAEYSGDEEGPIREAIMQAPKWSESLSQWDYERQEDEHDDTIAVHYVYVSKSRSLPDGRMAIVLNENTVLQDGPLPPMGAGVFRLSPEDVLLRQEGHSVAVDGLGINQAFGAQISTIASNHATHGGQTTLTPRAAGVEHYQLESGFNALDYDHVDEHGNPIPPPMVMNKLHTPPEMFTFANVLSAQLDDVIGGSPVQRGDPEATKGDSGSKAAMLFAAAQSVGNAYVQQVNNVYSRVLTFIIDALKHYATVPRIIAMAGDSQEFVSRRFVSKDLRQIQQVFVRDVDPSRDTFQGRMAVAEMILPMPEEERRRMLGFLQTGRLETMTEDDEAARMLIEWENEQLRDVEGPMPTVAKSDPHQGHYRKHMAELNDPAVRSDPRKVKRIEDHAAQHIAALTPGNPGYAGDEALMLTGQKPLPPPQMPGAQPAPPKPPQGAGGPPQGRPAKAPSPDVPGAAQGPQGPGGMPRMPNMPTNPVTGERPDLPVPGPPSVR